MILAAGRGTRLGGLGQSIPKVLIDIGGAPLLERHLRYLEEQGIRRVVINTHHRAESIRQFVEQYTGHLEIILTYEEQLLGTAGGVRNALPYLEPGPFLVLYGDILIDQPVKSLLECHRKRNARATLAVHEAESSVGKGVVEVDPSGRVTKFTEKATRKSGRALINSGLYILNTDLVAELWPGVPRDFGHDVFPSAVDRGVAIFAVRLAWPVIDIGTPDGLYLARSHVESRTQTGRGLAR